MITQFGEKNGFDYRIANGATGCVVCVIITVMAILMLTGVRKDYKFINSETR